MRAIFTESLVHKTLFNTVVYGSSETHIIVHNLKNVKLEATEILEINFFSFISSDSCHKKMLLESVNIPLILKGLIIYHFYIMLKECLVIFTTSFYGMNQKI